MTVCRKFDIKVTRIVCSEERAIDVKSDPRLGRKVTLPCSSSAVETDEEVRNEDH